MKKKLLLLILMLALFVCVFALTAFAVEFSPQHTPRTYIYYKDEIAQGNELFTINAAIENRKRFEIITSDSGIGFAKTDANGTPLTWYMVSDDNGGGAASAKLEGTHKIVVKCVPTVQTEGYDSYAGTIENGVYKYNTAIIEKAQYVVSANFTGLEITSFASNFAGTGKVVTTDSNTTEYCEIAGTTYLLYIYLPDDLQAMPSLKCSPVIACEFENDKVDGTRLTTLDRSIDFCANLRSLRIPEGITSLGTGQILRELCSLTYVKLPSTLTEVSGERVFCRSNAIQTVVLSPSLKYWSNPINGEYKTMYTDKGCGMPNGMKYIYVPNTISKASKFDQFDIAPASKLVFFFAGTKDEALTVAGYTSGLFKAAVGKEATFISYEAYLNDTETYNNYTDHIVVYGVNKCDAFYDGVHEFSAGFFGTCSNCGKIVDNPFTSEEGFRYSTREEDGSICAIVFTYDIDQKALAAYKAATGKNLMFGVLTLKADQLGIADGKYINPAYALGKSSEGKDKLIFDIAKHSNADLTTTGLSQVNLILRGETSVWEASMADAPLYMVGYAYDGENAYFMGAKNGSDVISKDINDVATITYKDLFVVSEGDFDFLLDKANGTATIVGYSGTSTTGFIIPKTCGANGEYKVTAIGAGAFDGYGQKITEIRRIYIPTSVKTIGLDAFNDCNGISIVLYKSVDESGVPNALEHGIPSEKKTITAWLNTVTIELSGTETAGNAHIVDSINNARPAIGYDLYS